MLRISKIVTKTLYGVLLATTLLALNSCLKGGKNEQSRSGVPGIIRLDMDNLVWVIDAPDFLPYGFYAPGIESLGFEEGDCLLFTYTVDLSSAENANYQSTGIIQGTFSSPVRVEKFSCYPYMNISDTAKLMDNENPIAAAIDPSYGCTYFSKTLFLFSQYEQLSKEETEWHLYYPPNMEAVEEDGKRVYSLFLRATVATEGTTPKTTETVVNAFDAYNFFRSINNMEASNQEVYIKFNYIKEIKEDSTFTWAASSLISYIVPEE
ncbi:MAG: hypothetical protein MdMp024_1754 [Bacteroidales bacterium]